MHFCKKRKKKKNSDNYFWNQSSIEEIEINTQKQPFIRSIEVMVDMDWDNGNSGFQERALWVGGCWLGFGGVGWGVELPSTASRANCCSLLYCLRCISNSLSKHFSCCATCTMYIVWYLIWVCWAFLWLSCEQCIFWMFCICLLWVFQRVCFVYIHSISISNHDWQFGDHTVNEVGFSKVLDGTPSCKIIHTDMHVYWLVHIQTY